MKKANDYYAKLARTQGYPARSVYKLKEIQEKYAIIRAGNKILDLGASPGSWSQYVLELLRGKGLVMGVDLKPVEIKSRYLHCFQAIQGSLKHEDVLDQIKAVGPYHSILSDVAPSTSGDKYIDSHRSLVLAEIVMDIARENLRQEGNLVIKIFQGGEEKQIYDKMKKVFKKVKAFKPKASKNESVEIFYLGFSFCGQVLENKRELSKF